MGTMEPGQTVTVVFPIRERTEKVKSHELGYTVTYRGAEWWILSRKGATPRCSNGNFIVQAGRVT